jgi:membrane fusion protein, multidrug efflux system
MRSVLCAAMLASALTSPIPAICQPILPKDSGPLAVGVMVAVPQPVAQPKYFVGRIEAVERVGIRARVTGTLEQMAFKEGDVVTKGQLLYRIEQAPFADAVMRAQGAFYRMQATSANAAISLHRAEELLKTGAVATAIRDQRLADAKSAQGDVITADANLRSAQNDFGYTEITAPITGIIGRTSLTVGNIVSPESGVLATIVSEDPMYVVFPVSHRDLLEMQRNEIEKRGAEMRAALRFSDGSTYKSLARLGFLGISVDKSTDTITVRGTVPNPDRVLVDGQLVRVAVERDQPESKILVPQFALLADQAGTYVFVVQDGKAEIHRVKLGGDKGPYVIIDRGVAPGEQVITEGAPLLRPGVPVSSSPAAPLSTELAP